jgi:hypothetical protein
MSWEEEVLRAAAGKSCLVCGDDSPSAKDAILSYSRHVPEMEVCWKCAKKMVNGYWLQHSGETFDQLVSAEPAPRSDVYRKATIGASLRKAVFERDMYRCKHCSTHLDLSIDHIVPESKGGASDIDNLQTLCRPCNSRKGVRT